MDRLKEFEDARPRLFALAYRMLGSVQDAEDMVQDCFLRWRQARIGEVRAPAAYLTTTMTHLCLDHLRSARVRHEHYVGPWLPEPLDDDYADASTDTPALVESLSSAFLLLLQSLSPIERAVFLLREVFDHSHAEVAAMLGCSEAGCRQLALRARRRVNERRSRYPADPQQQRRLALGFLEAIRDNRPELLIRLLADDVSLWSDGGGKVTAASKPVRGLRAVSRLLLGIRRHAPPDFTAHLAHLNGQPAIVNVIGGQPYSTISFDVREQRIHALHIVANPDKLRRIVPVGGVHRCA